LLPWALQLPKITIFLVGVRHARLDNLQSEYELDNHQYYQLRRSLMKLPSLGLRYVAPVILWLGFAIFMPGNCAHANTINVTKYGAVGDGATDNQQAINAVIAASKPGDTIYFPRGNYMHSAIFYFSGVTVTGDGSSSSFITATNPVNGALEFNGPESGVRNVCVQYNFQLASQANSNAAAGLWFYNCEDFDVEATIVQNVSGPGIVCQGCTVAVIGSSTISSLYSLAVEVVNCPFTTVSGNSFPNSPIAVSVNNSQVSQPSIGTEHVSIQSNQIQQCSEGIYVVGVYSCSIYNNTINNCPYGGVIVEGDNLPTVGNSSFVTVQANTFSNCGGLVSGRLGTINVLGSADGSKNLSQPTLQQVTVTGNILKTNNAGLAVLVVGVPGQTNSVANVSITNNDIENVIREPGIVVDTAGSTTITGNIIKSTGAGSIYLGPNNGGTFIVNSNSLQNSGANANTFGLPQNHNAVIDVEYNPSGLNPSVLNIANNTYSGSTTGLSNFIFDGVPQHLLKSDVVSGNSTTTLLPNLITP
jgi:parallel beta-helix repeat protein